MTISEFSLTIIADEEISYALESMSKAPEPELSHKKSFNEEGDEVKDIQYLKEE